MSHMVDPTKENVDEGSASIQEEQKRQQDMVEVVEG